MRHCGLDPQSQNSEELTTMRFRVEHGMTECACHPEVAEPRQNTRNWLSLSCHPEFISGSQARDSELAIAPQNDIICHCEVAERILASAPCGEATQHVLTSKTTLLRVANNPREARQNIRDCINPMRHCGLDPQSQNSEEVTTMRFRVKHGMTECACHCESAKRPSQSQNNMPKAVTNGSHLTVHCSQESTHPNLPSQGKEKHAPQDVKNRLTYSLNNLLTSQKPPTRKSKISTLPSREGKHAPQALTDLTSYRLNDLTSSKKAAFTLAEVLITLAIIGVVAAMTIPTLINQYQEKVFLVRWQKIYAVLCHAYENLKMDNGTFDYWEQTGDDTYKKFKSVLRVAVDCPASSGDNVCFPASAKYQTLDMEDYKVSNFNIDVHNSSFPAIMLNSGETIKFIEYLNTVYLVVDVNGKAKPNVLGRDTFLFSLSQIFITYEEVDGKLVVKESKIQQTENVIPGSPFRWGAVAKLCNPKYTGDYLWYNGASCGFWIISHKNMDYLHLSSQEITENWIGWK